jgi:redox-sensitive bicupin YhaK (pirin superfamily)
MLVFTPAESVALRADSTARVVLLGGAPLDGRRYIHWNFVSSSRERIEQAKRD